MVAGYSGTPLHKKLGIKAGMTVFESGMPEDVRALIESGVTPVRWTHEARKVAAAHVFITSSAALGKVLKPLRAKLEPDGFIWVSWPKKASGVTTDVSEDRIRELALRLKLVDIKVCAVTEIWSGLKLVIPVAQRNRNQV